MTPTYIWSLYICSFRLNTIKLKFDVFGWLLKDQGTRWRQAKPICQTMSIVQITDQKNMLTVHLFTHSPTHDLKIPNVYCIQHFRVKRSWWEKRTGTHGAQTSVGHWPASRRVLLMRGKETRRTHRGEEHAWKSHRAECACSVTAFPLDRSMFCVLCFV